MSEYVLLSLHDFFHVGSIGEIRIVQSVHALINVATTER